MAYTNAWSNAIPAGSVAANFIDDHIRQLRLDIDERLATIVNDIDADPLTLKTNIVDKLPFTMHWSQSVQFVDPSTPAEPDYATDTGGFGSVCPANINDLIIREFSLSNLKGITISEISAYVYRAAGASVAISLGKQTRANPPVSSSWGSTSSAIVGWHALTISGLSELIDPDVAYFFTITLVADSSNADSARLINVKVS